MFLCCQSKQELRMRGNGVSTHPFAWVEYQRPPPRQQVDFRKHGKCPKYDTFLYQANRANPTERKQNIRNHGWTTLTIQLKTGWKITGWRSDPTGEQGGTFEWVFSPIGISHKTKKLAEFSGGCFCSSQEWGVAGGNPKYASLRKALSIADQETDRRHRRPRGNPLEWVQTLQPHSNRSPALRVVPPICSSHADLPLSGSLETKRTQC